MNKNKSSHLDYEIAIIGAGFAGVGAGIRLKMQGDTDFVIFEKAASVGGTWRDNTYPGCACDIPSFLYSYSFEPNPEWTSTFSKQKEIWSYLKACVDKYEIESHIQYNTAIRQLNFDEAMGCWHIKDVEGKIVTARTVISAAGPFQKAFIPNIKGKDTFKGESFHSLHWNHDYDLQGKKVAVIGTGASAIQFVPEIAPHVGTMSVFQRTPPYIAPKPEQVYTEKSKNTFRRFPLYQKFWRELIYWTLERRGKAHFGDKKIRAERKEAAIDHLNNSVKDPELRKKLTPDYEIGCKRILISEDYYPTLQRDNVALVTDAITEITETGVMTKDGQHREVDAIIYGTGFYAAEIPDNIKVFGLNNRDLIQEWNETGGEAYYGMAVSGFPNLNFMVGPNTGLGHNSIIHMMESQLNYILAYIKLLRSTPTTTDFYNLKEQVQADFNKKIQKELAGMVWSDGGCKSYYLKGMDGKNTSIWPGSTVKFRKETKRVKAADYSLMSAKKKEVQMV